MEYDLYEGNVFCLPSEANYPPSLAPECEWYDMSFLCALPAFSYDQKLTTIQVLSEYKQ